MSRANGSASRASCASRSRELVNGDHRAPTRSAMPATARARRRMAMVLAAGSRRDDGAEPQHAGRDVLDRSPVAGRRTRIGERWRPTIVGRATRGRSSRGSMLSGRRSSGVARRPSASRPSRSASARSDEHWRRLRDAARPGRRDPSAVERSRVQLVDSVGSRGYSLRSSADGRAIGRSSTARADMPADAADRRAAASIGMSTPDRMSGMTCDDRRSDALIAAMSVD